MTKTDKLIKEALSLSSVEKVRVIDTLITSLEKVDPEIEQLWAKEAEDRIDSYNKGELKAVSLEK